MKFLHFAPGGKRGGSTGATTGGPNGVCVGGGQQSQGGPNSTAPLGPLPAAPPAGSVHSGTPPSPACSSGAGTPPSTPGSATGAGGMPFKDGVPLPPIGQQNVEIVNDNDPLWKGQPGEPRVIRGNDLKALLRIQDDEHHCDWAERRIKSLSMSILGLLFVLIAQGTILAIVVDRVYNSAMSASTVGLRGDAAPPS